MVTFILSQSICQFPKSRVIFAMRTSVTYVLTSKTRANFSFLRVNMSINVPTCHRYANYSTLTAKKPTNFSTIFQNNFLIMISICRFQKYFGNSRNLSRERKNLNFDICKFHERLCQPKTFGVVLNGACGINQTIIRLV